jgi:HEPN domain-containing protein
MIGVVSTMLHAAREWLEQADYDLETAEHMFRTGRYLYVIFFCHLALEKALKAAVVEVTQEVPPRTHSLIRLAQGAKISLPEQYADFLGVLNDASVLTRYPANLQAALSRYTQTVAQTYLRRAKEVLKWIKSHPPLSESSTDTEGSSLS